MLAGITGTVVAGGLGGSLWLGRPPSQLAARPVTPVSRRVVTGALQFDFGKVWFGNVTFVPQVPKGTLLTIRMGEKLGPDGRIDPMPPGTVRYHKVTVRFSGKAIRPTLTDADRRGTENHGKSVMPLRYVEIEGLDPAAEDFPMLLEALVDRSYSRTGSLRFEGEGGAPEQLNRLVDLGLHTMEATSFMGIFVDGDRERLPYEADAYINQLGWYVATADPTVPRRTLAALLAQPTWPSEWMVHMVFIAWADYRMTGDRSQLASVIDRLKIFSLAQFIDDTGLVTTQTQPLNSAFLKSTGAVYLEDIVDWPQAERDGFDMVPYNTVVNAFVFEGQRRLAELYAALGRTKEADHCTRTAASLREAMLSKLIDPTDGLFVDGLGSTHKSAHASFIPLAFGMLPESRVQQAVGHIETRIADNENGFPCSVYAAQYLLEGLFGCGASDLALKLMLNPGRRGWLNMLDTYDATITHEAWDPAFKENIDWTHAWGAAFLNILQRQVLGVRIIRPGWGEWTLSPTLPEGLVIEARIPTPHGPIDIHANGTNHSCAIEAPAAAKFRQQKGATGHWRIDRVDYRA